MDDGIVNDLLARIDVMSAENEALRSQVETLTRQAADARSRSEKL